MNVLKISIVITFLNKIKTKICLIENLCNLNIILLMLIIANKKYLKLLMYMPKEQILICYKGINNYIITFLTKWEDNEIIIIC